MVIRLRADQGNNELFVCDMHDTPGCQVPECDIDIEVFDVDGDEGEFNWAEGSNFHVRQAIPEEIDQLDL